MRYMKERQRHAQGTSRFTLADDDEEGGGTAARDDDGTAGGLLRLTHGGRALGDGAPEEGGSDHEGSGSEEGATKRARREGSMFLDDYDAENFEDEDMMDKDTAAGLGGGEGGGRGSRRAGHQERRPS